MIGKSLATAFVALAILTGAGDPTKLPDSVILERERVANFWCRGGHGDQPETWAWCDIREALGVELTSRGWCFGREGETSLQLEWHRCGPGSLRSR